MLKYDFGMVKCICRINVSDMRRLDMAGTSIMENITVQTASEVDPALLRMLDRGIEDIRAGRVLPHDEAIKEIERIREQRKISANKKAAVS